MSPDPILQALEEHRKELKIDVGDMRNEMRTAITKLADAMADLGKAMARSEERHSKHEAGMSRIGHQIDDHEARVRYLETHRVPAERCQEHQTRLEGITKRLNALAQSSSNNANTISVGWKVGTAVLASNGVILGLVLAAFKLMGG